MRHRRSGRKLGRDASHRKALYANLTGALIEHGRIRTTAAKAKEVRPVAEQMITLGRPGGYSRIVRLGPRLGDAAEMVYLELVDYVPPEVSAPPPRSRRERAEEETGPEAEEQSEPAAEAAPEAEAEPQPESV